VAASGVIRILAENEAPGVRGESPKIAQGLPFQTGSYKEAYQMRCKKFKDITVQRS